MENQLEQIDISLSELEKQMKRIYLPTGEAKNDYVASKNLPYMNDVFIDMLIERGKLPTPFDFFIEYLDYYSDKDSIKDIVGKGYKTHLRGRLFRTYPSLLRDIHFGMSLKGYGFDEVVYNSTLDGKLGVDLLVIQNGIKYAVHLYVVTQNSLKHRKHKIKDDYGVDCSIELPLQLSSARAIGEIKVYSFSYFFELLFKMNKYLSKEIGNR
jgi:hypothetical protein